jgi:hypothetical protein
VLKTDTTQDLKRAMFIHNGEPPGMRRPGSPPGSLGKADGWQNHVYAINSSKDLLTNGLKYSISSLSISLNLIGGEVTGEAILGS